MPPALRYLSYARLWEAGLTGVIPAPYCICTSSHRDGKILGYEAVEGWKTRTNPRRPFVTTPPALHTFRSLFFCACLMGVTHTTVCVCARPRAHGRVQVNDMARKSALSRYHSGPGNQARVARPSPTEHLTAFLFLCSPGSFRQQGKPGTPQATSLLEPQPTPALKAPFHILPGT